MTLPSEVDDAAALVLVLGGVERAGVARLAREAGGVEALQVVDVDEEQHEHHEDRDRDPAQRTVQFSVTTWVSPSSCIGRGGGRRAVSLTRTSRAMRIQLPTSEDPPCDRKGVVIPVSGMSLVTPPTMTKTCRASMKERPPASSDALAFLIHYQSYVEPHKNSDG